MKMTFFFYFKFIFMCIYYIYSLHAMFIIIFIQSSAFCGLFEFDGYDAINPSPPSHKVKKKKK